MVPSFEKTQKWIFVVRCCHCGQELARSAPMTRAEIWNAVITPCGCTSDAETSLEEIAVPCP